MVTIKWCINKGELELIEPNNNLAKAYIQKAVNSLETLRQISDKDWKISTSYYTMYFSLYSILMKIGIKCEIHSCTIEFMGKFLCGLFTQEDCELIKEGFKSRIDAQYYTDRSIPNEVYSRVTGNATRFMLKCKKIVNTITEKQINEIREKLKKS